MYGAAMSGRARSGLVRQGQRSGKAGIGSVGQVWVLLVKARSAVWRGRAWSGRVWLVKARSEAWTGLAACGWLRQNTIGYGQWHVPAGPGEV